jgi:hypothetical protein
MRPRSRSTTARVSDPYGPQAELAAAESNFREAAARRAELDAEPVSPSVNAFAATIAERERDMVARQLAMEALENRLAASRRRVEQRLEQAKDRRTAPRPTQFVAQFALPRVDESYFDAGSNAAEDEWWSRQLGKPPQIAA